LPITIVASNPNGYGKKKIKTSYGEAEIKVPRDGDASFNLMIVHKFTSVKAW
jgi:putative transposase